jgi:hypothetical protein
MKTIDITKVDLSPKSMLWMTVAFGALILMWGGGNWLAGKVKGIGQKAGPADEFAL